MVEVVRRLQQDLDELIRRLADVRGTQVGPGATRRAARDFVDAYFRQSRESLRAAVGEGLLLSCDDLVQELLRATQHNTTVRVYRNTVDRIRDVLRELETASLVKATATSSPNAIDAVDQRIVDTLRRIVPSAALSYEQAVLDLQQNSRLSWRGPATDLREALRECLDHLAPDDAVQAQPGFKLEQGTSRPTTKQKVRFILKSRGLTKSASQTPETAADAVEEAVGAFVRSVYTRSSVSTHTPTHKSEVIRVRDWVRVALCELLEIS